MATENDSSVVKGHSKQEPTIQTEPEVNSKSLENTARETKVDSRPLESDKALPAESIPNPNQSSSEGTKSAEDFKAIDPSTSPEQALAGAVTDAQPPSTADTAQAGDKQERNPSSAPAHDDKAVPGESTEPARKKQKISKRNGVVENGQPAAPATGSEQKSGRSKKVKDTVKRIVHTDGIGSRTRSRTKAAAT
ncbi:hypothetical protein Asppvi_006697 [Aspergillus pseudoviridinutans]|uniref:Uncharacterized protein n=1 Tax=Aspergillus pseudoviridinutans TaxID=1517512 RepID=A0A9P3BD54_9EURO|nr:uncharacterized protein Asppvi_006697 [Aspergillus pseudoviridinutans]GIJ87784.1 hypothetical protein Asppvi_006697 [Aspergillus pseudoviridinutans]